MRTADTGRHKPWHRNSELADGHAATRPPAVAAASLAALNLLHTEAWRQAHLQQLISLFRGYAQAMDLPLMDSPTAIQPLMIGDANRALQVSQALQDMGILVTAIRPPTVPANSARLRTVSYTHLRAHET